LKTLVIIISAYILITLIITQRNVLGIVIVNTNIIVTIIITQRIILGVIIVNIVTAAILIIVTVPNITLGIMTYGIITGIVTTIGSIVSSNIIIVQGMLGITTTCMEDTTIVPTTPTNPTALAISSTNHQSLDKYARDNNISRKNIGALARFHEKYHGYDMGHPIGIGEQALHNAGFTFRSRNAYYDIVPAYDEVNTIHTTIVTLWPNPDDTSKSPQVHRIITKCLSHSLPYARHQDEHWWTSMTRCKAAAPTSSSH